MSTEREIVHGGTFSAQVKDLDLELTSTSSGKFEPSEGENLGVRDTTVVSRLWVWFVLAVTVAAGWTTSHLERCKMG